MATKTRTNIFLSDEDRKMLKKIIAHYKLEGMGQAVRYSIRLVSDQIKDAEKSK